MPILIEKCEGFEWDEGNSEKNWIRHRVSKNECEEVFFNRPVFATEDTKHTENEQRFYVLGQTDAKRRLFISFAIRKNKIRVISARDMSKKERQVFNEKIKRPS